MFRVALGVLLRARPPAGDRIAQDRERDGSKPRLDVAVAFTGTLRWALDCSLGRFSYWDGARWWLDTKNNCIAGLLSKYLKKPKLHEIGVSFHELSGIRQISESGRLSPGLLQRSETLLASSNDLREDLLQLSGKHDVADLHTE
jgi:hypothetical protein